MAPAQAMSCTGRLIGSKRCPLAAAAAPRRRCHLKARGVVTVDASRSSVSKGTGLRHKPALQALQSAAANAAAALGALGLCAAQALAQDASPAAADAALSAEPGVRAVQEVLLDVWKEVDERFIDAATAPVDWRQAQQDALAQSGAADNAAEAFSAIPAMLSKLGDVDTRIVPPALSSAFQTDTTGQLVHTGIQVARAPRAGRNVPPPLLVAGVMEGSAAERAGISVGSQLLAINGRSTAGLPDEEAAAALQGDAEVLLLRAGVRAVLGAQRVRLAALPLQVYPVHYAAFPTEDGRRLGYISIQAFGASTAADARGALATLEAHRVSGYVLDLRSNGGGLVSAGMRIAEMFLDKDALFCYVTNREADGEAEVTLEDAHAVTSAPLVVLVNGDTASTSEMLTGALHAAGRAVTAGAHTFGKGRTQRVVPMRDGSTLLVSASLLTTPAHERIDKVGLEPDIACPANGTVPAAMTPAGRSERALVAGLRQDECMRVAARALARPSA